MSSKPNPVGIPAHLDDVTAQWLTQIMQPRYPGIVVEGMEEVFLRNSHTTKYQVKLTLNDVGKAAGIPDNVCLKANWAQFDSQGICRLEARFYEDFRRHVAFPAPRSYFEAWDPRPDSGQGLVVMEDLTVEGGHFGISTDHMGVEEAARAVASLARIHGAFWDSPVLHAADWLPVSMATPVDTQQLTMMYGFAEQNHSKPDYQAFLPGWIKGDLSRLHGVYNALIDFAQTKEQGPWCLVHGDSHQGNSYVRPDGERVWLDWQLVRKGRPIRDFTYFVLGALTIEERRAHDRELLRHYRNCLIETGALGVPDDDTLWEYYRRWPPYAMQAWIANMDEWGQKGMHIVERIFVAGEDLGTVAALGVQFRRKDDRMTDAVTAFRADVPEAALDDLRLRLRRTRWPEGETVSNWSQGVPLAALRDLCAYWADGYDWRRCESTLNALPQFTTSIDDLSIHFIHVRSPRPDALPLILTHGWPGSVLEFLKVLGPLTNPAAHGAPDAPAFHVVIPSLPGYGFSDKPTAAGWGVERIAQSWIQLMRRLGYDRFAAQGGDWGAAITTAIAMAAPPECIGVHLNMPLVFPEESDFADLTPAEARTVERMQYYQEHDSGYAKLQGTRPQTIGYGLADSPVAQAAWIYEKFQAWTDNRGVPENALTRDEMLDVISLYWLTNSGASSARLYWESANAFQARQLDLPVGVSIFAQEIFRPSRRWAERSYLRLIHWNELDVGGHFAAFEQPALFVAELRACFGAMPR